MVAKPEYDPRPMKGAVIAIVVAALIVGFSALMASSADGTGSQNCAAVLGADKGYPTVTTIKYPVVTTTTEAEPCPTTTTTPPSSSTPSQTTSTSSTTTTTATTVPVPTTSVAVSWSMT